MWQANKISTYEPKSICNKKIAVDPKNLILHEVYKSGIVEYWYSRNKHK
jgi:hypothetical protein